MRRYRERLVKLSADVAVASRGGSVALLRHGVVPGEAIGEELALAATEDALGHAARAAPIEDEGDRAAADEHPDPGLLVVGEKPNRRLIGVHHIGLADGGEKVRVDRLEPARRG